MYLNIKAFDHISELSIDIVGMFSTIDEDAEVLGEHGGLGLWHGLWHGERRWSGIGNGNGDGNGLESGMRGRERKRAWFINDSACSKGQGGREGKMSPMCLFLGVSAAAGSNHTGKKR